MSRIPNPPGSGFSDDEWCALSEYAQAMMIVSLYDPITAVSILWDSPHRVGQIQASWDEVLPQ
jgi:hypothetical protein